MLKIHNNVKFEPQLRKVIYVMNSFCVNLILNKKLICKIMKKLNRPCLVHSDCHTQDQFKLKAELRRIDNVFITITLIASYFKAWIV